MSTAPADAVPDGKVIQMSEEALLRLLNEARGGGLYLPPGAERDQDGVVYRVVNVPTGRIRLVKDAEGKVIKEQHVIRRQKRVVMLVQDPSPAGLVETAKKCKRQAGEHGPDFYHPRLGWVRCGAKREVDVTENLGTGSERFEMVFEDVATEETFGATSSTMQGVPIEDDDDGPSGLASLDDAIAADPDGPLVGAGRGRRMKES